MIEHDPWVGPLYESEGVRGQRLGIVGYSSWTCEDHVGYTIESVEGVISGDWKNARFFNDIANYFGMDRRAFYERVVLFEFVPCAIGGPKAKFATAAPEQAAIGAERALRIAHDHEIEKLLVFSRKAWRSMPKTIEQIEGRRVPLGDTPFEVGHYQRGSHRFTAVGLRHPQYAPAAAMRHAVGLALAVDAKNPP